MVWIPDGGKFDDIFSHFDTIAACNRQTGGQSDGHVASALCIHIAGEKCWEVVLQTEYFVLTVARNRTRTSGGSCTTTPRRDSTTTTRDNRRPCGTDLRDVLSYL